MWYILFIFITIIYFYPLTINKVFYIQKNFILFCIPYIILWVLLIGSQDNVGSDYPTYLYLFNGNIGDIFLDNDEWVFNHFVKLMNSFGFYGQSIFFILSFICICFLILFIKKSCDLRYVGLFLFLFITVPGIFNNQMNGIRQYIAVYMISISFLNLLDKKWGLFLTFLYLSIHIHASSLLISVLFISIFCYLNYFKDSLNNKNILYILLFISLFFCFTFDSIPFIKKYLEYLPNYRDSYWLNVELESTDTFNKIRKIIYFPYFWYCVSILDKIELTNFRKKIYITGIIGFCIKTSFLGVVFINRMGQYFEIFMCIPLFYSFLYMKKTNRILFYISLILFFLYYFTKVVIFPIGEYSYNSVFI